MSPLCSRCGHPGCLARGTAETTAEDVIACRDRELSNLRAQLRSVTLRLEKGLTLLDDISEPCSIRGELEAILEQLS